MIRFTDKVISGLRDMAEQQSSAIGACAPENYIKYYLDTVAHARALYPVAKELRVNEETRMIEIGSGIGLRCMLTRAMFGAECVGVEPCVNSYSSLGRVITALREANPHLPYTFLEGRGEATGLPSESFDVALSFEVIEHVQDPAQVIGEIFRLLKPGGRAYLSTCNYASFYEGHYRCFWWPFAGKRSLGRYLRLIGRNPAFLSELNLITKRQLLQFAQAAGFADISIGPLKPVTLPIPTVAANFPAGYVLPQLEGKTCFPHRVVEHPRISAWLANFDREYKLRLLLTKP